MTNTQMGEGIRRNRGTLGPRNFENSGTVPYKVSYALGLSWVDGATYSNGSTLPYDVGGVSYSKAAVALLRRYWDADWLYPLT